MVGRNLLAAHPATGRVDDPVVWIGNLGAERDAQVRGGSFLLDPSSKVLDGVGGVEVQVRPLGADVVRVNQPVTWQLVLEAPAPGLGVRRHVVRVTLRLVNAQTEIGEAAERRSRGEQQVRVRIAEASPRRYAISVHGGEPVRVRLKAFVGDGS